MLERGYLELARLRSLVLVSRHKAEGRDTHSNSNQGQMGNCFFVAATDKGRGNAIAGGMAIAIPTC